MLIVIGCELYTADGGFLTLTIGLLSLLASFQVLVTLSCTLVSFLCKQRGERRRCDVVCVNRTFFLTVRIQHVRVHIFVENARVLR